MPSLDDDYPAIRDALAERYGRSARTDIDTEEDRDAAPFSRILIAWLSRSVPEKNARAARDQLRDHGLLDAAALVAAHPAEIIETLRSAGIRLTPKAIAPLPKLARWIVEHGEEALGDAPTASLRDALIAINGIGAGTADAILLQALDRPVFPVDRPRYRVFARHGWIDITADYDEARDVFERREPEDPEGLRQLATWLDHLASDYCRASKPRCEKCPLHPFLPAGGLVDPSAE